MLHPTFDSFGYPSDDTLDKIINWNKDWKDLMAYIQEAWKYDNYFKNEDNFYTLVTGGWSGNESLIGALKENYIFWSLFWVSSHRGGRYEFELK